MPKARSKLASGRAVGKRGIVLSSAYNRRTAKTSRITEASRKTAQARVRDAMRNT